MKLTLGFSPCPNDTFIFDALVNGKIDNGGLEFEVILEDVETLNKWSAEQKLDITKLSFPAFFEAADKYKLLDSGSALGKGVGPLLVSAKPNTRTEDVAGKIIALPGEHTTAHFLFNYAFPSAFQKKFMVFSAIEDAVISGQADLGVIIHENRFTYRDKGLFKVMDLGEFWEEKTAAPVPLGGIAISNRIEKKTALLVQEKIKESVLLAFKNYPEVPDYVKQHSQTMKEAVMRQHIELYVNNYSLSLGDNGKKAIMRLYDLFLETNPAAVRTEGLFL